MKNILITGGLGHIGSKLIELINIKEFKKIIVIDNLLTQRYPSLYSSKKNKFEFYNYSILDPKVEKLFLNVDVVIHLAAIVDAANSFDNKDIVKKVNFTGTKKIIKYCSKYNCKLIFPSTTSVYGVQKSLVDEECSIKDLKCQSPYAEYKLKAELYLKKYSRKKNIKFVILRLGTIYGISIGMRFQTAVNKFCWLAALNQPITVWRTAVNQKRPYLGINDAVKCFQFIIRNDLFNNSVYNVVSSNNTVSEILDLIRKNKKNIKIKLVKSRIMNQLSYEVSSNKIKKIGLRFHDDIKRGINDTLKLLEGINNE